MKYMTFIILPLFILLGTNCFLQSGIGELIYNPNQTKQENLDLLNDWLMNLQQGDKFNGSVLLAQKGRTVFSKAYGSADHTGTDDLTTQHSFRLASISKQFTAACIMLLQQEGKLSYDDQIIKYLPALPWKEITIRQMLTHTSGLPDYESDAENWKWEAPLTTDKVIDRFAQVKPDLDFTPGDKYEYSNTGYIFLAKIVEKLSGQSFEKFIEERIFSPLQMESARVWNHLSEDDNFRFKAAGFNGSKPYDICDLDGVVGDGGIFCSSEDFMKWDQSLYENSLINVQNLETAYTPVTLNSGETHPYGFGWQVSSDGNRVAHSGGWLAARTYMMRDMSNKSLFVILDNSSNRNAGEVGSAVMEFFQQGGWISKEEN